MRGPSPDMIAAAQAELATRERSLPKRVRNQEITPQEAERSLASWRAIVALLRNGAVELEPCLGTSPSEAWLQPLETLQAAIDYRASKNEAAATHLRHARSLLIKAAIRAGAEIPSFDPPEQATAEAA